MRAWWVPVVVALGVVAGCGDDDEAEVPPPSVELIEPAVDAVEAELGRAPAYFEINVVGPTVNLFVADGQQLAAVRYCFDFGCYATEDASRLHEANLTYLSLWYTAGRDYALHGDEWKMTGGIEQADSILIASEPLTRDTAAWVEVPEYAMLHAEILNGRPAVTMGYLD